MKRLAVVAAAFLVGGMVGAARAEAPSQEVTLGKDQKYFLIGDTAGDKPKGLLLVLPGGDGSAEYRPFVTSIQKDALPDGYLVAQLVSVPSKNPNQVVWPTKLNRDPKQAFTTEEFIRKVVADVKTKATVDDEKVMALGWSSSGPAEYAAAVAGDVPVKKWFVAMSVFVPQRIGDLSKVKGQKFYLLHSPQDMQCRYVFSTRAKEQLAKQGATVKLVDYAGGHGWHGNVFANIRAGVEWLEKSEEKAAETAEK